MNKYTQVVLLAAEHIKNGMLPRAAWEQASCEIFPKGSASQVKGCPKNAFLGLYDPTVNTKNAAYAMRGPCVAQGSSAVKSPHLRFGRLS